jgi:magnesium transporter
VALSHEELYSAWSLLSTEERVEGFRLLSRPDAEDLFDTLDARDQSELVHALPEREQRVWIRLLAPDDVADLVQESEEEDRAAILALLDDSMRKEVLALLAYQEDIAGGLMNPRFARLRPEMSVDAAISYLRRQTAQSVENIYYGYVLDSRQRLLGVVSLRELVSAKPGTRVDEIMETDLVTVPEEMDQEQVSHLIAQHDLMALPVIDADGCIKGVVTVDDIVDVVREEATEDIQKLGGTEALEAPYLQAALVELLKKRIGWLALLLLMSFITARAMRHYQHIISTVGVLAAFVPVIISTGGNTGSQAATLVIRAIALEEVRTRDWWRVAQRELTAGLTLGLVLGGVALATVIMWNFLPRLFNGDDAFGENYMLIGLTVAASIVSVVLWGTMVGSMLPFVLKRIGLDPASASAPLVATIADVTGLVIYFSVATAILTGTLL